MNGREPSLESTQITADTIQSLNLDALTSAAAALRQDIEGNGSQFNCTFDPNIFEASWFNSY